MLTYSNLREILSIPERELTEAQLDFSGLKHLQVLDKWKANVSYSLIDREKHIEEIQYKNKRQRLKLLRAAK
jgi:hypothetical protein